MEEESKFQVHLSQFKLAGNVTLKIVHAQTPSFGKVLTIANVL